MLIYLSLIFPQQHFKEWINQCNEQIWTDEVFHLGNDGIIHFTEGHGNEKFDDFCVDIAVDGVYEYDNGHNSFNQEDYSYNDGETDYYSGYNDTSYDEYYHYGNGGSNRSTCNVYPDPRPHTMVAMICAYSRDVQEMEDGGDD